VPYFELSLIAAIFVFAAAHLHLNWKVNRNERSILNLLLVTAYLLELTDDEDDTDFDD
jgi:hypothetical protein